ncbi:MAG TPA: type II secretion system F family protein, partial [Polyangiales bacterium]|nr:type II secretion system F family protein [Polyangiales bacterium]
MSSLVLRELALALFGLAAFGAARHIAALPTEPVRRAGLRGMARARARDESPAFRLIEPLLRWLAIRLRPLCAPATLQKLDAQLTRAGDPFGLDPAELCAAALLAASAGAALGGAYAMGQQRSGLYAVFLAGLLGYVPFARLGSVITARATRMRQGLPGVVDLLCLGLSAGLDFPAAVRQVIDKTSDRRDVLAAELGIVLREIAIGKTRREALEVLSRRNPSACVQEFVASVTQAEEEGTPLAEVLAIQATVSRQRRGV